MAWNKLSSYCTTWFNEGSFGGVTYHRTNIVTWKDGKVTLNSDGWQTVTTKRKMNQASHQFALGYGVYQENFDWFVTLPNGETVPYQDNMTFSIGA